MTETIKIKVSNDSIELERPLVAVEILPVILEPILTLTKKLEDNDDG